MRLHKLALAVLVLWGLTLSACTLPAETPTNSQPGSTPPTLKSPTPPSASVSKEPEPPQATISPTPTEKPSDEFSTDNLNQVPPAGILEEITLLGVGGSDRYCGGPSYSRPELVTDPADNELMLETEMVTCGWQPGQELTFKVFSPSGKIVYSDKLVTAENGRGNFAYRPQISDPEGLYQFEIRGPRYTFESNAYFREPVVPRFYDLSATQLFFNNFKPGEMVRLLLYACNTPCTTYRFEGWQAYPMDKNGQLLVNAQVQDHYFLAITESGLKLPLTTSNQSKISFEISLESVDSKISSGKSYIHEKSLEYLACPAQLASRIAFEKPGKAVTVRLTQDLSLFANPRTNAREIIALKKESILRISYWQELSCSNGLAWRWVAFTTENNSSYSGHLIEINAGQNHTLEQITTRNSGISPTALTCPGNLSSRLKLNAQARVAFTDGTNMRIRSQAGFSKSTLHSVPEGTLLTIISGPECLDNVTWWQIRTDGGLQGWMTEYQNNVYLLEPYP